jgi:hypothetical protein
MIQITKNNKTIAYHDEFYSVAKEGEHWIRLTDGCFRSCWNCYTPKEVKVYDLPQIKANKVRFLDQNFLYAHPNPLKLIKSLPTKLNKKVIRYMFYSGLDFTLFNQEILNAMKEVRIGRFNDKGNFINGLSIAWDRSYQEKDLILKSIDMMIKAGYRRQGIQVRMLCNGKISYNECMEKLAFLFENNIQIDDCWFDNQKRGKVIPIYWTKDQCKKFGDSCRANNVSCMQNQHKGLKNIFSSMIFNYFNDNPEDTFEDFVAKIDYEKYSEILIG